MSVNDSCKGKISFVKFLLAILYTLYGKEKGNELFAYYEKYSISLYRCDDDLVKSQPLHRLLLCAISLLEHIALKEDVEYFEAEKNFPDPVFRPLTLSEFLYFKNIFYENHGKKLGNIKLPSRELYFSDNAVTHLLQTNMDNIINHKKVSSALARKLELVGREIDQKGYSVTTAKDFNRTILLNLYPRMSLHERTFIWKFFKSDGFEEESEDEIPEENLFEESSSTDNIPQD